MAVEDTNLRTMRGTLAAGVYPTVFLTAFLLPGHAQQPVALTDGVYSIAQASRGQQLYRDECVTCHGDTLQGQVGPPLTGDQFLSFWSERPVTDLVDKIHNTMPPETSGPPLERCLGSDHSTSQPTSSRPTVFRPAAQI